MVKKIRLVLLFGSNISTVFIFANGYLFYLFSLLKITQFNTVQMSSGVVYFGPLCIFTNNSSW